MFLRKSFGRMAQSRSASLSRRFSPGCVRRFSANSTSKYDSMNAAMRWLTAILSPRLAALRICASYDGRLPVSRRMLRLMMLRRSSSGNGTSNRCRVAAYWPSRSNSTLLVSMLCHMHVV